MLGMLGKEFTILAVGHNSNSNIIAIPSPDGSQNGMWYFPNSIFYKSGNDVLNLDNHYVSISKTNAIHTSIHSILYS